MAMANKSLACILSLFVFLMCFALSTEARFVTNDEKQVKPSDQVFEMTVGNEPKPPYYVQGAIYDMTQKIEKTGGNDEANVWCIVKPTTEDQSLHFNLEFSCKNVNCSFIEPGGPCFYPNNDYAHASAAMNYYYKSYRYKGGDCYFSGSGLLVNQDPSGGTCCYV